MTTRFAPGDVVGGDFEIVRLIGEGGMGAVYEAKQRSTGALRAIKTMLPELARDPDFQKRFTQEAQVVAKVDSEHVVQVLSAGIDAELGVPWIAMELLKGEDLATRLTRTAPLDFATAGEIFSQIGHAFSAAHAAGVVHRDLKPENVFVCEARSSTRAVTVKILDFGIAKVLTSTIATSTGSMGSPLWMSPEQTVKGGTITPAADVWAYGLMAFYALTGRFYWHAPNGIGGTPMTLMREITLDPIESASARSRALGGATLPPGFDEWFARCLEREPSARFEDASRAVPPLVALLAAAPKRAARAIEMAVTQGVPPREPAPEALTPAAAPAPAVVPAPAVAPAGTGVSFANTKLEPASPARPAEPARPSGRVGPAVLAGLAALALFVGYRPLMHALGKGETSPTSAPSASASAATQPAMLASEAAKAARAAKMITFGGDRFVMGRDGGADDERPPVSVSVAGFALDVSEVSVAFYFACVEATRCKPAGTTPACNGATENKLDHPANCVSYVDAKTYCEWVDKRLPTESEWERAARGTSDRRYPWGAAPPGKQLCWKRDDEKAHGTCKIGSFPAGNTPEGLEDMAGGVWEWTTGRYCTYDTSNCTDERRVARGGSWASVDPDLVTTTVRKESFESDRGASVGFRCARSL